MYEFPQVNKVLPQAFSVPPPPAHGIGGSAFPSVPSALGGGVPSSGGYAPTSSGPWQHSLPSAYMAPTPNLGNNETRAPKWGAGGGGGRCGMGGGPVQQSAPAGELESRLVDDICRPAGAKVAPTATALLEFTDKCRSLDAEVSKHAWLWDDGLLGMHGRCRGGGD